MSEQDQTIPSMEEFLGEKPRSRLRRWAKFWIPGVILLLIALAVSSFSGGSDEPQYISQEVKEGALSLSVTATGNLRPTNQVNVGSEVSGRIEEVYVDVNDRVSRGQVVARINTEVIDQQIAQAQANLNAARATVEQARASLNVDMAQLNRLRSVYAASKGKVPSKSELDVAEAAVARDKAQMASAQANVQAAAASLQSSITTRGRSVIRSPVAGVVLVRKVEPGQTVAASFNTPTMFIIAEDLSAMQLRVDIDEADVGQVGANQKATFTVDAYPGKRFPAQVERIDLGSTSGSETTEAAAQSKKVVNYEARLTVANAEGLLRPGMTATATIETGRTAKGMLVPNAALRFNPEAAVKEEGGVLNPDIGLEKKEQQASIGQGSRQRVHVLQSDGTLKAIEVVTGQSNGRQTSVTSKELKPGMKVVTGAKASAQ